MASSIICKLNLKGYKTILVNGEALFRNYSKIKNFLIQRLGVEYAFILAEPYITEQELKNVGEASWSSDVVDVDCVPLSSLSEEDKGEIYKIIQSKLGQIQNLVKKLLISNDIEDRKWAEFIQKAFDVPSEDHILVQHNQFVFVAWGFEYEKLADKKYSLSENLIKNEDKEPISESSQESINPPYSQEQDSQIKKDEEIKQQAGEQDIQNKKDEEIKENTKTTERIEDNSNSFSENKKTILSEETTKPKNKWRKYRWLLLVILFLILFLWFMRQCSTNSSRGYLPEKPNEIVPIDTTKIENDSSGYKRIVNNRLNVALIGKNPSIENFAKSFKKVYPETTHKIIYYDTLTFRIQIEIPKEEREKIKKELPKKMPEFEMLIFEEGIMTYQKRPNDPIFRQESKKYWYHEKVKALEAWDITNGDSNIVVAIIDDGFDLTHPELRGKIYKPRNVAKGNSNVMNRGKAGLHGTHVAGIALGMADNGQGSAGIASNCKFMPIQVGDDNGVMSQTAVIDGILYAIHNGANVVNMSLGMAMPPGTSKLPIASQKQIIRGYFKEEEAFYDQLFEAAYKKNIIFVLAGGNDDVLIGFDPMQRSKHTIKVSATDPQDYKAVFSNHGELSTISAPGVQIYNSIPGNKYDYLDGTSMAAPIVAGGIALIKSANPALSFSQIVDLLQSTGLQVTSSPDRYVGNIMQLDKALGVAKKRRDKDPILNCPDAQAKIDSLQQAIERIRIGCMEEEGRDTLKIPDNENDFAFAEGRWKSTTYIYNENKERVVIYFEFMKNATGKITLVEPDNTQCTADLSLKLLSKQFNINQVIEAVCSPISKKYQAYTFECKPDKNGYAECTAQNKNVKENNFTFKLVKIK